MLVLDAEGLVKLAAGDARTRGYLDSVAARGARVAVSAITLMPASLEVSPNGGIRVSRSGMTSRPGSHTGNQPAGRWPHVRQSVA